MPKDIPTNAGGSMNPTAINATGQVTNESMFQRIKKAAGGMQEQQIIDQRKEVIKEVARNQFVQKGAGAHRNGGMGAPKKGSIGRKVSAAALARRSYKDTLRGVKNAVKQRRANDQRQQAVGQAMNRVDMARRGY